MIWVQFAVVLIFIFLGARMGSIGIGFAGGAGVIVLGLLGLEVDPMTGIPWDVIGIIMSVISAIAAMQVAGGLDYLVKVTEKVLRSNPKRITYYAPIVTFFMTVFTGTGHVTYSAIPVIVEVAKESNTRPSRPLSIAVVASQVAIVASPISAAVVLMATEMEQFGVEYMQILAVMIPVTFVGVLVGAFVASKMGKELVDDPVYQERLAQGLIQRRDLKEIEIKPHATRALWIFGSGVVVVMAYAMAVSDSIALIENPTVPRNAAIMIIMLAVAMLIGLTCKISVDEVSSQSTFKGGMSAAICVLGVAWLGNTFVNGHLEEIASVGGSVIESAPWLLAVVLFFASALLYSQGATTAAMMPVASAIGVAPAVMVASFPAVTGLFVLPTYPTVVAAVEMDDTGSTRIGKFVFNHPFFIPGVVTVAVAVVLGFGLAPIVTGGF